MPVANLGVVFMKTRKVYLDVIRAVAVIIVAALHFSGKFASYDVTGFHNIFHTHANGTWGQVGTTLFYLLSGASLISNYSLRELFLFFRYIGSLGVLWPYM